jgi:hypothetical protein
MLYFIDGNDIIPNAIDLRNALGVCVKGHVCLRLIDTVSGLIVEERDIDNLLLNYGLNISARLGRAPLGADYCKLGTSGQEPSRTDDGILGTVLATASSAGSIISDDGVYPVTRTLTWRFVAGVGTGEIAELVVSNSQASNTESYSRVVLSPPITKTSTQELLVEWTFIVTREADSWSGTITGGQRDGVTDINWVATINNRQVKTRAVNSDISGGSFRVIFGTSNALSDLVNDGIGTIKGTQIFNGIPNFASLSSYTTNSYYRDFQVGFEINQAVGSIGEMILATDSSRNYNARITFNPPLDKTSTYRLYLDFRYGLSNMS